MPHNMMHWLLAVFFLLSGATSLTYQVVWMRILVQSFSATVSMFAIMVACFLFGICWGSHRIYDRLQKGGEAVELLAVLELGLAVSVAALALVSYVIPPLFGGLIWGLTASTNPFGFTSVLAQFIVAGLLIVEPMFLLGATFPVAVQAFTPSLRECAYGTGAIYAANTLGAVLGPVLGGFLLRPRYPEDAGEAATAGALSK